MPTMDFKDIKVGETYLLPVTVTTIKNCGWLEVTSCDNYKYSLAPSEVKTLLQSSPYTPLNLPTMTEIPETYPKYDPCRKFRKGDKAKPRIINGREIPKMPLDVIFTVTGDEDEYGAVPVEYMSPVRGLLTSTTVHAVWLKLITPVEEQEPYYVSTNIAFSICTICKRVGGRKLVHSAYYFVNRAGSSNAFLSINEAQAAAKAECARLNAEWRKEVEND